MQQSGTLHLNRPGKEEEKEHGTVVSGPFVSCHSHQYGDSTRLDDMKRIAVPGTSVGLQSTKYFVFTLTK